MASEKGSGVEMKELSPKVHGAKDAERAKAEKKADKIEIEEAGEGDEYSNLDSPTEDIYNPAMPSSSSKPTKEAGEHKMKEEGNVYNKLRSATSDIYNPVTPPRQTEQTEEKAVDKAKNDNGNEDEDLYCKLNDLTENVYMAASAKQDTDQKQNDAYKKVRLYKMISAVSIILCVILLAVVLALVAKLNVKCPESADMKYTCERCHTMCFPHNLTDVSAGNCEPKWRKFGNSCFFKSELRLNWQKSREACQKMGGDLPVIDNESMQRFLTIKSNNLYWIGLSYQEQQWMWINNTALVQRYWIENEPIPNRQGSCALLLGGTASSMNWMANSCDMVAFYFCQKMPSFKREKRIMKETP